MSASRSSTARSYSSKKSYGNKTTGVEVTGDFESYSSKKSYGNKTKRIIHKSNIMSYSSKKSYGNKTGKRLSITKK